MIVIKWNRGNSIDGMFLVIIIYRIARNTELVHHEYCKSFNSFRLDDIALLKVNSAKLYMAFIAMKLI